MSNHIPAQLRRLVSERSHGLCEYCLIHEQDTFLGGQIEHVIAKKHGGETAESNLAFACAFCNRNKGSDIATRLPDTGKLCRLYNPRADRWSEHFRLDGVLILGITEIGRATTALLGFNDSDRVLERETLAQVDRYPSQLARQHLLK